MKYVYSARVIPTDNNHITQMKKLLLYLTLFALAADVSKGQTIEEGLGRVAKFLKENPNAVTSSKVISPGSEMKTTVYRVGEKGVPVLSKIEMTKPFALEYEITENSKGDVIGFFPALKKSGLVLKAESKKQMILSAGFTDPNALQETVKFLDMGKSTSKPSEGGGAQLFLVFDMDKCHESGLLPPTILALTLELNVESSGEITKQTMVTNGLTSSITSSASLYSDSEAVTKLKPDVPLDLMQPNEPFAKLMQQAMAVPQKAK